MRNGYCSVPDISNWRSLTVISLFHWYIWLCIISKINKLTNSRHQFLSLWSIWFWNHSLFPCAWGDHGAGFMESLTCIIIFIKQCHSHSQICVLPSHPLIHFKVFHLWVSLCPHFLIWFVILSVLDFTWRTLQYPRFCPHIPVSLSFHLHTLIPTF